MRYLIIYCSTFFLLIGCGNLKLAETKKGNVSYTSLSTIDEWSNSHTSNQPIFQEGKVHEILQDDNDGNRHQKFIVQLSNNKTLLISHNIDIASRITDLENGDSIIFSGIYEWNKKGGVVHWTHKDPQGKHPDGYLMHNGKRYD